MRSDSYKWLIACVLWLLILPNVQAKTVVLVHGFQSDKSSWYKHRTADALLSVS